ncbi:MAG TPA: hypothetical protein VGQ49_16780 [Bryobacteraceae bacterium]|nr:hypothetical protein [Bryobacteraceae bacterium]
MAQTTNGKPQDVFEEAAAYVRQMEDYQRAERLALHHLETADGKLLEARKKQASDSVQQLIDNGDLPASEMLPEEIRVNHCRGALLGARRMILEHDKLLPGLQERLDAARTDYNKKTVSEFLGKEFAPAVAAYTATLKRAAALGSALGESLSPTSPDGSIGSCFRVPAYGDWVNDPSAQELHAQHRGRKESSSKLARYAHEALQRVNTATMQSPNRQIYDPRPGTKYRANCEFAAANGRTYQPGDIVDSFSFPAELIRLEVQAGKLQRVLAEDEI